MRISPEDRRLLNRRLKDRLPAAAKGAMRKVPTLVMIVTTTLFVTPEAWARIQSGKAEPAFVLEGQKAAAGGKVFTKTYSKEELQKKMPANPVVTMDQRLMSEVTGVLNGIAKNLSGANKKAAIETLKSREPTANEWALRYAAFGDTEGDWSTQGPGNDKLSGKKAADTGAIRSFFAGESQKVASTSAKARTPILNKFGQGMKWNFNLGGLFGKKEEPKTQTAAKGNVRYGLIVQDIKVDNYAPKRASVSDSNEELQYAGHAEVEWTIGPMTEEQGRKVYSEDSSEGDNHPRIGGVRLPSTVFKAAATPENFDNLAKVDQKNKPLMRLDLTQEDGFYNFAYRTELSGKKVSVEHAFTVPVAGTVALGRRFNDNWDVIQTSAYNVLYDKRLPLLSVHYMNIEQRYKADASYNFKGHVVGVGARGKAEGKVEKETDRPEAYSVNYTKDI